MQADGNDATDYEIHVEGHLDARWAAWFDGMHLTNQSDGTTLIEGPVVDQAALHGVLRRLADLGVPLLSVRRVPACPPAAEAPTHTTPSHPTPSAGSEPEGNLHGNRN